MVDNEMTVKKVRAALELDKAINLHRYPVKVSIADGAVVLEGDVEDIEAKKLALAHAGGIEGIRGVIDRLRVVPAEHRGDGAIREAFGALLLGEPEFTTCAIRVHEQGRDEILRAVSGERSGDIVIVIDDGAITLGGWVISLSHKRVLGVLAWWTPGCRDVVNALQIDPPEDDNDEEVVEALSLVLEMDPQVDAGQIVVHCGNFAVTLEGYVRTEHERRRAERDAWALFGVEKVIDRIEVQS